MNILKISSFYLDKQKSFVPKCNEIVQFLCNMKFVASRPLSITVDSLGERNSYYLGTPCIPMSQSAEVSLLYLFLILTCFLGPAIKIHLFNCNHKVQIKSKTSNSSLDLLYTHVSMCSVEFSYFLHLFLVARPAIKIHLLNCTGRRGVSLCSSVAI